MPEYSTANSPFRRTAWVCFALWLGISEIGRAQPLAISASGSPQAAVVGTPFASPLQVTVQDANNNPVAGVPVTFSGPVYGSWPGRTLDVYGDSISVAFGVADPRQGYASLLASALRMRLNNHAISGSGAPDQATAIYAASIASSSISTLWLGVNDLFDYYIKGPGGLGIFQRSHLADVAYLAIPGDLKVLGRDMGAVAYTGAWDSRKYFPIGKSTASPGATATFTVSGGTVLVSCVQRDGNSSTFTISVDGVSQGTFASRASNDAKLDTALHQVFGPNIVVLSGFDDAPHVIRIAVVDADEANPVEFDWAAGLTATVRNTALPYVFVANIARFGPAIEKTYGIDLSITDSFNKAIENNLAQLMSLGLNVAPVDTFSIINPVLDTIDGVHLSAGGHAKALGAFLGAMRSGPAVAFPNAPTVVTDESGVAALPVSANDLPGGPYTVAASAPGAGPVTFSLTNLPPPSADWFSGAPPGTMTFHFSSPNGFAYLTRVSILIDASFDSPKACFITYDLSANRFSLSDDNGLAVLDVTPGSGSQRNSQCVLNGAGSTARGAGNTLTLTLDLTLTPAFGGVKNVYMSADDASGTSSGWQNRGSIGTLSTASPGADSFSGTPPGPYTLKFSSPNGSSYLTNAYVLINDAFNVSGACEVYYSKGAGFLLVNDSATAQIGPVFPGSGTAANSQCTLNGAGSSAQGSGNDLILTLDLRFSDTFRGPKNVYMYAADRAGASSGWQNRGKLTAP